MPISAGRSRVLVDGRDGDLLTARTDGGRLVRLSGGDELIGQFRRCAHHGQHDVEPDGRARLTARQKEKKYG